MGMSAHQLERRRAIVNQRKWGAWGEKFLAALASLR